jgi:hypothetical protein
VKQYDIGPYYNSLLGNRIILDERRSVFYMVGAMHSAGKQANRHVFWQQKRCFLCCEFRAEELGSNSEASSCSSTEEYKKSVVEREWEFSQLSIGDGQGKFVVEEEKSACEDLVCD